MELAPCAGSASCRHAAAGAPLELHGLRHLQPLPTSRSESSTPGPPSPQRRHVGAVPSHRSPESLRRRCLLSNASSIPCFPASKEPGALTAPGPASPRPTRLAFCSPTSLTGSRPHGEPLVHVCS
uniref:Uncharacterized protein n=1 Tax=Triticum urartu TaxID=4572 RepID=A0A8R7TUP8_TRIUA